MSGTEVANKPSDMLSAAGPVTAEVQTIELLEEVLRVAKRTVEHGRVCVSVLTETGQQQVRETLRSSRVEVAHVTIGRRLEAGEAMPQARTENRCFGLLSSINPYRKSPMATGLSGLADAYHPQFIELRQRLEGLVPERLRCESGRAIGARVPTALRQRIVAGVDAAMRQDAEDVMAALIGAAGHPILRAEA